MREEREQAGKRELTTREGGENIQKRALEQTGERKKEEKRREEKKRGEEKR